MKPRNWMKNVARKFTYFSQKLFALTLLLPGAAFAALPQMEPPSQGGNGGIMATLKGYLYDAGIFVGLIVTAVAFYNVAGACLATFDEARKRGEWKPFVVTLVTGIALIVFIIWLASKAAPILGA